MRVLIFFDAVLPEALKDFDGLRTAEEMSKNSGKYFVTMLAACVYVILTISPSSDVGLFADTSSTNLPIVNLPINTVGFYLYSPVILLVTYIYFHLDLQRLWDTLARLPAVFPDNRGIDEKAYPWSLGSLARTYSWRMTNTEYLKTNYKPMLSWQKTISIALGWYFVPFALVIVWLKYIHRHHWGGTLWHLWLIIGSLFLMFVFRWLSCTTLRRQFLLDRDGDRRPQQSLRWRAILLSMTSPSIWAGLAVYVVVCFAFYGASVNLRRAVPRGDNHHNVILPGDAVLADSDPRVAWAGWLMPVYQPYAQLENAEIVPRPANWSGLSAAECKQIPVLLLQKRDFRYALMNGVFLVRADLSGSTLNGAELRNADLRQAILFRVHLRADLEKAHLESADLTGADLRGADLQETHLSGADLSGADLRGADLRGADLHGGQLSEADLRSADLREADLSGAYLSGARLSNAKLLDTDLNGADLSGADLCGANFSPDVTTPDLSGLNLYEADFTGVDLRGAEMRGADLRKTDLRGADLRGANHLTQAQLNLAITGADTKVSPQLRVHPMSQPARIP